MILTKNQSEIVKLMSEGWQLGSTNGIEVRTWLQKGGCGKGGESKNVNATSVNALLFRGIIIVDIDCYPTKTFKLSPTPQPAQGEGG